MHTNALFPGLMLLILYSAESVVVKGNAEEVQSKLSLVFFTLYPSKEVSLAETRNILW